MKLKRGEVAITDEGFTEEYCDCYSVYIDEAGIIYGCFTDEESDKISIDSLDVIGMGCFASENNLWCSDDNIIPIDFRKDAVAYAE